jgi:hypothetical protein
MYAVVNKLTLGKPIDDALLKKIETDFHPRIRQEPGFVELRLVRVSDSEAVILGFFASRAALDDLSSRIAGPWFAEHVRPYLAGPVERSVGEVVFGAGGG